MVQTSDFTIQTSNFAQIAVSGAMMKNAESGEGYQNDGGCDLLEMQEELAGEYNLLDRLVEFASLVIDVTDALPRSRAGNHIAGQLLRSGTSPAPNYAEAQAAESARDFVHKMKVCLKELRESLVWLTVLQKKGMLCTPLCSQALSECDELVRIFNASVKTARRKIR